MKYIVKLALAYAVLYPIAIQASTFDSSYTSISEKDCKNLRSDNMGSLQSCPGFSNIEVKALENDLRQSITFVRKGDGDYPQDFSKTVSPAMSTLGSKIEWRHKKSETDIPLASIVRLNVSEDPERPQRITSYLVVSKITAHTICVVGKVNPEKKQNEKAREMAKQANNMPCLDSNGIPATY